MQQRFPLGPGARSKVHWLLLMPQPPAQHALLQPGEQRTLPQLGVMRALLQPLVQRALPHLGVKHALLLAVRLAAGKPLTTPCSGHAAA